MAPRDMHPTVKKDWDERSKTAVDTSPLAGLNCRYGSYHLVTYYCELLQFFYPTVRSHDGHGVMQVP